MRRVFLTTMGFEGAGGCQAGLGAEAPCDYNVTVSQPGGWDGNIQQTGRQMDRGGYDGQRDGGPPAGNMVFSKDRVPD